MASKKLTRLEIGFDDGTSVVCTKRYTPLDFVVPDDGNKYWFGLHDFQTDEWRHKPRSIVLKYRKNPPLCALPETIPMLGCKPNDFYPLSREWQEFWFALLERAADGFMTSDELIDAWKNLVADHRAFTDGHAPQNGFIDYITGENLGSSKGPIQMKCLSTGGNLFKQKVRRGSIIDVETLDVTMPPPTNLDDVWGKHH